VNREKPTRRPARESVERGSRVVERVLTATLRELARIGYGALSIEEVAAAAGVNKTTVYRRWPTRAALVRAALDSVSEQVTCNPNTGSLRADLLSTARSIIAFASSPEGHSVISMVFAEGMEPELARIASSLRREHDAVPKAMIEAAVKRGELAKGADALLLMETLFGSIVHRMFLTQQPVDGAFLARLIDLLLLGAAGKSRGERVRRPARHSAISATARKR